MYLAYSRNYVKNIQLRTPGEKCLLVPRRFSHPLPTYIDWSEAVEIYQECLLKEYVYQIKRKYLGVEIAVYWRKK
jgi:hypothetical protein